MFHLQISLTFVFPLHEIKCSSADELIGPLSYFDFGGVLLCETEQEP